MRPVALFKHQIRSFYLWLDSHAFGRRLVIRLPNDKEFTVRVSSRDTAAFQDTVDRELGGYWTEYQPQRGEVHLDVGAQVGVYTLLAASEGATVYSIEPDSNNRRFLERNLKNNGLNSTIISKGAWNKSTTLNWRSQTAMSSIQGVGMLPFHLPALDTIEVETIDQMVEQLRISKVDVIKMDIEGAEIEAVEGASNTIRTHKPVLLIEAYHIREGRPTKDKLVQFLRTLGIPESCIKVTSESLLVVRDY
jgi:FkbM family methyltransferase